jgi:hypothetical protein
MEKKIINTERKDEKKLLQKNMRTTFEVLLPARFLSTVGHLMASIMVVYTKVNEIVEVKDICSHM